jgi:2-amino-4-hydroxy-6-hydroxymethyldihydropteridine diphosphokinase
MLPDKQRMIHGNPRRVRAFISLGSNFGDRVGFVQQAMQLLKDIPGVAVKDTSSLYETEPMGIGNRQWFVNAVTAIDTTLTAEQLLRACKDIEDRLLKLHAPHPDDSHPDYTPNSFPDGQRVIDLDILFFGDEIHDTDQLRIPHPNINHRSYALVPLLEIGPDFVHPALRKTVTQIHESLPQPEQVFLYGTRGADRHLD